MAELRGEGTVSETKQKKKSFMSLLLKYKTVLSKSQYSRKKQAGGSPTTCRDAFMRVPIVSHLLPADLISLSRCNKSLRNLLMNRSSKHIWTSAMENVEGLPPCPPEMSEPYYVRLLFLPDCTICGGSEDCEPYLKLLLRLCVKCRSKHLMTIPLPPRGQDELVFARELDGLVSSVEVFTRSGCVVRISGFTMIKEEANDLRSKFEELHESGDEAALNTWMEERTKAVEQQAHQAYVMHRFISRWENPQLNNSQNVHDLQAGAPQNWVRRYRPYIERYQL
ncbi:unnamed protein product [Rhizoctonia solani]|nr:unnamed protein product [Rhizoctonia solani]